MSATRRFDLFVSCNTIDHVAVEWVARAIQNRGLTVFLDRWEVVPGHAWPDALEVHLDRCRSVVLVLGSSGMGS